MNILIGIIVVGFYVALRLVIDRMFFYSDLDLKKCFKSENGDTNNRLRKKLQGYKMHLFYRIRIISFYIISSLAVIDFFILYIYREAMKRYLSFGWSLAAEIAILVFY
jgi:hypothetical protein